MTRGTADDATALIASLAHAPEQAWLEHGRALVLRSTSAALALFSAAATRFPTSADIQLGLAGLLGQSGQVTQAEALLRHWLAAHPGDVAATFLLARLLRDQGRLQAAGEAMRALFQHATHDADTVIAAVELLDGYGLQRDASSICESAITAGANDARLHAYAGMLAIQLGRFEQVRAHYEKALALEPGAVEWNIPLGLSGLQRYSDAAHADFAYFQGLLARADISDYTRRSTLFALGKACDDIGDYASAARYFSDANAMAHAHSQWSRKAWKRSVQARLDAPYPATRLAPSADWTPVFIVGVPRSGTTLLAERLSNFPNVRNRGELGWLQVWEERLSQASANRLQDAADDITRHLRQDDGDAAFIIDKQPLNLLRVDLIMALWPQARIICCHRDARDTALSLWMQPFSDAAHDYSYDFGDIATVISGCRRLQAHWQQRYPDAFHVVSYEQFVNAPDATLQDVAHWLGLSAPEPDTRVADTAIATASVWQARQPIYTRSEGRWRHYAAYVPELLDVPA